MPGNYVKKPDPVCPVCGQPMVFVNTNCYYCHRDYIEASYGKKQNMRVYGLTENGKRKLLREVSLR
jgi:hydrogenase maturation factor